MITERHCCQLSKEEFEILAEDLQALLEKVFIGSILVEHHKDAGGAVIIGYSDGQPVVHATTDCPNLSAYASAYAVVYFIGLSTLTVDYLMEKIGERV
jgi:hypothetical protein